MEALRRQLQHRHAASPHGVVAPPKVSSPRVGSRNARLKLPLNAVPGQQLRFSCDGKCYRIRVPDNATPGSVLTVTVPANSNDTPTAFPSAPRVSGVAPPPTSQKINAAANASASRTPVSKNPSQPLALPKSEVSQPYPVHLKKDNARNANAAADIRVESAKPPIPSAKPTAEKTAKPASTTSDIT